MQNEIDSRLSQMQRMRPSASSAPEIENLQTRASELEVEAQRLQKHFEEEVLKLKMIQEGQRGKLVEMVDRPRDETHTLLTQAEEAVDERFRVGPRGGPANLSLFFCFYVEGLGGRFDCVVLCVHCH